MKREEKKELLIESCKKINTYHFDRKNFTRAIEEAYEFGKNEIIKMYLTVDRAFSNDNKWDNE